MRMVVFLLGCAASIVSPVGAGAAVSATYDAARWTLRVESDGADPIVVACAAGHVTVNGLPATTAPLPCRDVVLLDIEGGPGANRIDLTAVELGNFGSKGVSSRASVSAGAGDDEIVGPAGLVLTRLDGGPGSDRIEGRGLDTYVFAPAIGQELDTVVEPGSAKCSPSYFETDVPNLSAWTVGWDALDFSALEAGDGVAVDLAAPGGIVATHARRTVSLRRVGAQPLDAVAGGAGADTISGACMADGLEGDDRLVGSPSGDLLVGGTGTDTLAGGGGPDALAGGPGDDALTGGAGADKLVGGAGDDEIAGGGDGDVYLFSIQDGAQTDTVAEGAGRGLDVLSFEAGTDVVHADLATPVATFAVAGTTRVRTTTGGARAFEGLIGAAGDDVLRGHDGMNHFWGGGGTDHVVGRGGDDVYHLDWSASMPAGAFGSSEFWSGPIERTFRSGRSVFDVERRPATRLRIVEVRAGGRDTLDLAEGSISTPGFWQRLEGQIRAGARVDLTGAGQLVTAGRVSAVAGTRATALNLENVRGSLYDDVIVGNRASNVLEGRHGRDRIKAAAGRDTCLVYRPPPKRRNEDVLRGCERTSTRNPDR